MIYTSNPILKFKGTYRVLPEINLQTNDFPRSFDGSIEDIDAYIPCYYDAKIMHYGHLPDNKNVWYRAYIPSLQRGRNIIKKLIDLKIEYRQYCENDYEVDFLFKGIDMEVVAKLLKAKTGGADIPTYSKRNLPKSDLRIPEENIKEYKEITVDLEKSDLLIISQITNRFIYEILAKKYRSIEIGKDIRKKCMSSQPKEYIFSLGEWGNYIKYLKTEINKFHRNKESE